MRIARIFLTVLLAVATVRTAWIFHERRRVASPPVKQRFVNPDYYVYPPRAYLSDFSSAQRLRGATLWVRDGYAYASYPYDGRTRETKDAPLLPPLQQIVVKDVIREGKEVKIIFDTPPQSVAIGYCGSGGESCRFFVDEMFFLKDPHELYSHWPADVWQAISRHEAREGMTEAQVALALGHAWPSHGKRTYEFRPPGRPAVVVIFSPEGYARKLSSAP